MQDIQDNPGITQVWVAVVVIPTSIKFSPPNMAIIELSSSQKEDDQSILVTRTVRSTLSNILPRLVVILSARVYIMLTSL